VSDLPPPPAPPGAVPPQQSPPPDPWRKYLWIGVASGIVLYGAGLVVYIAASGPPINDEPSDSGSCTTVDMHSVTGWDDPVTVVELDATTPQGETLYALGIGEAIWVWDTHSPNDIGIILPVNEAARTYDPVTGVDVDVFQSAYADAASEAEGALAD